MSSQREGSRKSGAAGSRRAFTLIELLVVILIIAVVISIVLPALGGARTAAKRSATQNLLTNITNAVGMFVNDERRLPGYFAERDMGSQQNQTQYGMSSMENVMLDLIGMPPVGSQITPGIKIGPTATTQIDFAFDMYGTSAGSTKQYYNPDPKFYVAQVVGTQQVQLDGASGHARADGDVNQLKDVVDSWGMPLLAWRQDETATKPIAARADFVSPTSATASRFYWASNACFLNATAAGKGFNQPLSVTDMALPSPSGKHGSMMGGDTTGNCSTSGIRSLAALLGNPSYPGPPPGVGRAPNFPVAPRGPFVLQSSGQDSYYLGNYDRGRKQFSVGWLDYEFNFVGAAGGTIPANQYTDKDGKPTTVDIMSGFDDLIATAGN